MVDQNQGLEQTLEGLTDSVRSLAAQQGSASTSTLRELESINRYSEQMYRRSLFSISGLLEKVVSILFDGFVQANEAQSNFNTILTDSNSLLLEIGRGQGDLQSAMRNQFRLLEVGFKKDNQSLRDLLYLEQVGMGHDQEVIGLIDELVAAGIDQGSIDNIVDSITDVAMNTSRTAEATVAALVAQGDLQAAFGAMGLADEVAEATLETGKRLGLTSASQLAKLGDFIARLYDPENIGAQAFLGVLNQQGLFSKDINVLTDAYFDAIMTAGDMQSEVYQQALASQNSVALSVLRDIGGEMGDMAVSLSRGNTDISDSITNGMDQFGSQAEKNRSNMLLTIEEGIKSAGQAFGANLKKSFDESKVGQWIIGDGPESMKGMFDHIVTKFEQFGGWLGTAAGALADGVYEFLLAVDAFANSFLGKTARAGLGSTLAQMVGLINEQGEFRRAFGDPGAVPLVVPGLVPTDTAGGFKEFREGKSDSELIPGTDMTPEDYDRLKLIAESWLQKSTSTEAGTETTTVELGDETIDKLNNKPVNVNIEGNQPAGSPLGNDRTTATPGG